MITQNQPETNADGCPDGENPPASCLENCEEAESYSPPTKIVMPPPPQPAPRPVQTVTTPHKPAADSDPLVLPHSDDAEMGLLGGLMMYPESSAEYIAKLSADDFATSTGRAIFSAYNRLNAGGQTIILAAVESILKSQNANWPDIENFLTRGCDLAIIPGTIPANFQVVKKLSNERRKISATHKLHRAVVDGAMPATVAAAYADLTAAMAEPPKGDGLSILSAVDMASLFPALRPYIVDRLLRQGETMNLIAAPKIGKSWLLMALLLAIASGTDWLGFPCQMGRVLLLDNELHPETLARRICVVADAMGVNLAALGDRLSVVSLRGQSRDLSSLRRTFDALKPGEYAMIGIDALYRALPRDCEENSNENMRDIYNLIDQYAEQTEAAFGLVHHSSKGNQSEKSVTDTGSGAGAISRAADVHCVIRPHEEADCAVMDCRIRSGSQPAPLGLRWAYPLWVPDSTLDVEALATTTRRKKAASEAAESGPPGYMAVVRFATDEPKPIGWFAAKATAGKDHAARSFLRQAAAVGAIYLWPPKGRGSPERWATIPAPLLECQK